MFEKLKKKITKFLCTIAVIVGVIYAIVYFGSQLFSK